MTHPLPMRLLLVTANDAQATELWRGFEMLPPGRYFVERATRSAEALELLQTRTFDAVLADQPRGDGTGLALIRNLRVSGATLPILLLGESEDAGLEALGRASGADGIVWWRELEPLTLDRQLQSAIMDRALREVAEREQARVIALVTGIQRALTQARSEDAALARCAELLAEHGEAGLAQIWALNASLAWELKADAGPAAWRRACAEHPLVCADSSELSRIEPFVLAAPAEDSRIRDPRLVLELGVRGVAAHPLIAGGRPLGMILLAKSSAFTSRTIGDLACVAGMVAQRLLPAGEAGNGMAAAATPLRRASLADEAGPGVMFQVDAFAHWSFLNPAWTQLTGFSTGQSLGTPLTEYIHQEEREKCSSVLLALFNRRLDFFRFELRLLTASGQPRWVEAFFQPLAGLNGEVHGISGSLVDVTHRHEAAHARERAASATDGNPNPVLELDEHGAITFSNEAARQLVERLGLGGLEEALPRDFAAIARRCCATGTNCLRQEAAVAGQLHAWSFFAVTGHPVVHCHGENVTENRASETQARHAEKIESLEQLTASVAHDFNNLLTVILGHARGLLNIMRDEAPLAQPLQAVIEAAHRGTALTRQLALFNRRGHSHPRALDLTALLNAQAPMLERVLGPDIGLQMELAPALPLIEGEAASLEQALMNLAVNAREAMPRGGALLLQTRLVQTAPEHRHKHPEAREGAFICLTVRDCGPGMDVETREHLFDRRAQGDGPSPGVAAGIGLATVYGTVHQHAGWIEVETAPGAGTAFHIYLPCVPKPAAACPAPTALQGNESVLLVDDEPDLRDMLGDLLTGLGYRVQAAPSASDALQLWEECHGDFDLVVSDVLMAGGLNGRELAEQLLRRKPGLKVILSSGSSPEELGLLRGTAFFDFLPKPYAPEELARLVRKSLDERALPASPGGAPARSC